MVRGILTEKVHTMLTVEEVSALEKLRKEYSLSRQRYIRDQIIVPYLVRMEKGAKK